MVRTLLLSFSWMYLMCSSLESFGQTQRQIANRKIRCIQTHTEDHRKDEISLKTNISFYNRKGQVLETIDLNADSVKTKWETFEYNRKGNVLLYQDLDCETGLAKKSKAMVYDKWGNEVSVTTTNEKGEVVEVVESTFNNLNDKVDELTKDGSGNILKRISMRYDEKGMMVKRTIMDEKGEILFERRFTYTY